MYHFRRLAKEYPKLNIADSSAFRAAVAFENGKRYKEAAQEYLNFQATLPTSALAISALTAAAENFRNGKDTANAIKVLLETIYAKYPKDKDSTAFKGIAMAASLYDSSGRQNDKAKTLEIYMTPLPGAPTDSCLPLHSWLGLRKGQELDRRGAHLQHRDHQVAHAPVRCRSRVLRAHHRREAGKQVQHG